MKRLLFLTVALILGASCASHSISHTNNPGVSQNTPTPESAKAPQSDQGSDVSNDAEKKQDVPVEFTNIDFKNFSYPISGRKAFIRLKDGKYEFDHEHDKDLGDGWFDLKAIDYADLTGDGKMDAVVQLIRVECGGSCDGGSHLFYFYSIAKGRMKLLSRIETGSIAYTCGLKSFFLRKQSLVLEAFRKCSFNGVSLKSAYDADVGGNKFIAKEFTRLTFEFNRRGFVLKKTELLPNPDIDVKNYPVKISINND